MEEPSKVMAVAESEESVPRLDVRGAMLKYSLHNALYWFAACPLGYASTFMLGRGISATQVGLTLTLGSLLTLLIQPFIASNADGQGRLSIRQLGMGCTIGMCVFITAANLVTNPIALSACISGMNMFSQNLPAISNAISVFYINRGGDINYGLARGIGSISWAIMAAIMGYVMEAFGTDSVIRVGVFCTIALFAAFSLMPTPQNVPALTGSENASKAAERSSSSEGQGSTYIEFLRDNPKFLLVVLGFCMCFANSSVIFVYAIRIIENVGGDASNLGIAMAISAASEVPAMWGMDWVLGRVHVSKVMRFAAIGYVVRHLVLFFAGSIPMIYLGFGLQCVAYAVFTPASVSYCNTYFAEGDKNKALGLMVMVGSISGIVSNIFGGILFDLLGLRLTLGIFTALTVVGVFVVFMGIEKENPEEA